MTRRETRIDRLLRHLDRVIGPIDEVSQRIDELGKRLPRPPVPPPPFLPIGGGCDNEVRQVVTAFYRVLKEELGEQRAEDLVRRAARIYSQSKSW